MNTVKNVYDDFIKLKAMQALNLAHVRAMESFLESAKRYLEEGISTIRKKLLNQYPGRAI